MRYASVCDGIGAVHVAWQPLGWRCSWTSEIEPFPAAVVEHHWGLDNLGDMTRITEEVLDGRGPIEVLVGGTPCQSFSPAGLRLGLQDPRGNLALKFVQLAAIAKPRWVVWENVPGVLRTNGGRDFGAILGALVELGYWVEYRILDAQFFGVPQRRRRVYVVGRLGVGAAPVEILFDKQGGGGVSASPSQEIPRAPSRRESDSEHLALGEWWDGRPVSQTLDAVLYKKQCLPEKNRFPAVLVPAWVKCDCCEDFICQPHGTHAHECSCGSIERWADADASPYDPCLLRYITPLEAERLQGFPDDYTNIPCASDTARYRAIGNSMAVPVMRWLGQRIDAVERSTGPS